MPGFNFDKSETVKTPDAAPPRREVGALSGAEHFSRWDLGKDLLSGISLDKLRDPYYTDKAERIKNCPVEDRFVPSDRGEGMAHANLNTPTGLEATRQLEARGLEGIVFRKGFPDFSPVAVDSVTIPMTSDRMENYRLMHRELAAKWSAEAKDGNPSWTAKGVKEYIKQNKLERHECEDGKTCMLVPSAIHDAFRHIGGRAECAAKEAALYGGK